MQRVTISMDDALAEAFDTLAETRGYASRSEAMRDVLRETITAHRTEASDGYCVANLSYVYNHHERGMAARLMTLQHAHHDLVLSTTHIHLDHDDCLETLMLKGPVAAVRHLSDTITAERGVRHGLLNLIAVNLVHGHDHSHDHGHGDNGHRHDGQPHIKPL